ncbi:MAG TPA: hypothetical protein VGJ73_02295, partial [Verrucomicrobiae bacterium]
MAFLVSFNCFGYDTNRVNSALGGSENVETIANADSVRVWRTLGSLEMGRGKDRESTKTPDLGDFYLKSGKAKLVSANLASKLSELLLNKNYGDRSLWSKNCMVLPGVIVSFSKGNQNVDAFFCFDCNIFLVKPVNQTGYRSNDFDAERPAFLSVIKKIFRN